jgi:hypothetical protein
LLKAYEGGLHRVVHLDRGGFSANSALCFKPGRTEVHEKGPL